MSRLFCWADFFGSAGYVQIRKNFCGANLFWCWTTENFDRASSVGCSFCHSSFLVVSFPSVSMQSCWRAGRRARVVRKKESKTFWSHLSHIPGARGIDKIHEQSIGTVFCHIQRLAGLEKSETLWTYIPERFLFFLLRTFLNFWRNNCETVGRWLRRVMSR